MRAVLLIHGFASDQNDFGRLVPYLWSRYDEVVCQNLPAHGKGEEKSKLDHKKIIQFVTETFDKLAERHQTVDVIGFSMGGALAAMLAGKRKVNRLVLLAPAIKFLSPWFIFSTIKYFSNYRRDKRAKKKGKAVRNEYNITNKEMWKDIGDALKRFFGSIVKKYTPKNIAQFSKVVKNCNKELSSIYCPVLILWGKLDQLVPFASVRHVVGYCRHNDVRTIVYTDASHMMLYSRVHYRISDDILRFFQRTDPPSLCYNPHKDGLVSGNNC